MPKIWSEKQICFLLKRLINSINMRVKSPSYSYWGILCPRYKNKFHESVAI